jgi:hypothetical protein
MASNNQLIQGVKDIGVAQRSVTDPGKLIGDAFAIADERAKAKKKTLAESEAKVESYLDKLPTGEGIAKIPQKYRDQVNGFLIKGRNEYADIARTMANLKPSSDQYVENVRKMNAISNSFKQLDNQFKAFGELKNEFGPDLLNKEVSKGVPSEDIALLTQVSTDELDIDFTPEGNISFNRGGKMVELGSMPKYFNQSKAIKPLIALNASLMNQGREIDSANEVAVRFSVKNLIREGGRESILSLATDDYLVDGGLGITDEDLLTNPERHDELEQVVIESWMTMLKATAKESKLAKDKEHQKLLNERAEVKSTAAETAIEKAKAIKENKGVGSYDEI